MFNEHRIDEERCLVWSRAHRKNGVGVYKQHQVSIKALQSSSSRLYQFLNSTSPYILIRSSKPLQEKPLQEKPLQDQDNSRSQQYQSNMYIKRSILIFIAALLTVPLASPTPTSDMIVSLSNRQAPNPSETESRKGGARGRSCPAGQPDRRRPHPDQSPYSAEPWWPTHSEPHSQRMRQEVPGGGGCERSIRRFFDPSMLTEKHESDW